MKALGTRDEGHKGNMQAKEIHLMMLIYGSGFRVEGSRIGVSAWVPGFGVWGSSCRE